MAKGSERVQFKIVVLTYKVLHRQAPQYLPWTLHSRRQMAVAAHVLPSVKQSTVSTYNCTCLTMIRIKLLTAFVLR